MYETAETVHTEVKLILTDDERRYLAGHARNRAADQLDPRYWSSAGPTERTRLHQRWEYIAQQLTLGMIA